MLKELLTLRKSEILQKWFSLVVKTYPGEAARFMENESNRFANPVGETFSREFKTIFDALLNDDSSDGLSAALEKTIKIRAVQDFTASRAVAFIFFLKTAIRQILAEKVVGVFEELLEFESRIDSLALAVFDRYMANRERIFSIRLNEAHRNIARSLERYQANIAVEQPDNSRGSQDDIQK